MCTTESKAKEALRQVQLVMSKLGLALHPEKTRMGNWSSTNSIATYIGG